jgi:hypothetical protein
MSNDTTTDSQEQQQPLEEGQAKGTIEASAESLRADEPSSEPQTQEPETTEEVAEDNSNEAQENSDDSEELIEWARSKGVDPEDPVALAKLARDTEKGFRQYSEKAKAEANELRNKVTSSEDFTDSEAVIQEARVINFYNSNPDARNYDQKMGEIYARFQQSDPEFAGHLVRHLDTLYAMAKAEDNSAEVINARNQGKVEATQAIKKAQTASAPKANAVASKPAETGWTEQKVQEVIAAGKYSEHREEILAWERSLYS